MVERKEILDHGKRSENSLPPITEEAREHFSATAFKFFITASREAPASTTAQGALIARYCQKAELDNPETLGNSLLEDDDRINKLTLIAGKTHQHVGKGPDRVSQNVVKGIISTDFSRAQEYINFSENDLEYITGELQEYIQKHHRGDENFYHALACEAGELGQRHTVITIDEAYSAFKAAKEETIMSIGKEFILKKFGEVY